MKYYKFLTEDNLGEYSMFDFTPYLPSGDEPGEWLPEIERLELCESGYHACKAEDLLRWINAQLYEVEYKEEPEEHDEKVNGYCIRFMRKIETWNDRTARLFAVWCAREALKLVDSPDERSINACDVSERYANGEATKEELDAAYAAARSAAWDAPYAAARAAAWDTARAAACAVAWIAAKAASWDAANAATAWDAANAASWSAGLDAAYAAARSAQSEKLIEMLGIE